MTENKYIDRTMEYVVERWYNLGHKLPVKVPKQYYLIRIDDDNCLEVQRTGDQSFTVDHVCIPCLHDAAREDELRKEMKKRND
jgi:hypothetical protein